ncbi:NAD(P)/FAD-dependent oxidoreductase [Archangium minus]|uniref:NAD(P)/FAD-dependent oxidoreductase n=1 Tax=Archangium minus TaxID=83450 RepID=A0ABY9WQK0_9BACT|nr:NAD(P)/FAD-dependent oxidoreductase [Archangium minus]
MSPRSRAAPWAVVLGAMALLVAAGCKVHDPATTRIAATERRPLSCEIRLVGGGPAGTYMAYRLAPRFGAGVCLFEKEAEVGGRLRDETLGGVRVGWGARRVNDSQGYVKELPQAGEEEARAGKEAAARTERMKQRKPRVDRAELQRRTFDFDVFAWVRCEGRRRVLAYVKAGGSTPRGCAASPPAWRTARAAPVRGPPRPLLSSPHPPQAFSSPYASDAGAITAVVASAGPAAGRSAIRLAAVPLAVVARPQHRADGLLRDAALGELLIGGGGLGHRRLLELVCAAATRHRDDETHEGSNEGERNSYGGHAPGFHGWDFDTLGHAASGHPRGAGGTTYGVANLHSVRDADCAGGLTIRSPIPPLAPRTSRWSGSATKPKASVAIGQPNTER